MNERTPFEEYLCPLCRNPGLIADFSAGNPLLHCAHCEASFPVISGIPRFVPATNYSGSFGLQWTRHRRTQLDSYVGKPFSEERLFTVTGWPRRMDGAKVLEAGSGAGRFTEILCRTGTKVYSFDYSSAVDANALNNSASRTWCSSRGTFSQSRFPRLRSIT